MFSGGAGPCYSLLRSREVEDSLSTCFKSWWQIRKLRLLLYEMIGCRNLWTPVSNAGESLPCLSLWQWIGGVNELVNWLMNRWSCVQASVRGPRDEAEDSVDLGRSLVIQWLPLLPHWPLRERAGGKRTGRMYVPLTSFEVVSVPLPILKKGQGSISFQRSSQEKKAKCERSD